MALIVASALPLREAPMTQPVRWVLARVMAPLRHDPAWFELASIMGAVGWAVLGIASNYDFADWPSMRFISDYVGDLPLYLALMLGVFQGIAVFAVARPFTIPLGQLRPAGIRVTPLFMRAAAAFLASWWWFWLGLGIANSLPAINMHVALYVVMGVINLMAMGRLALEPPDNAIR